MDTPWPDVLFQESRYKKTGEQEIKDIDPSKTKSIQEKTSHKAITCLKIYDDDDDEYTQLEIHDKGLRALIQIMMAHCHYLGPELEPEMPMHLYSPYNPFIHDWVNLEALAGSKDDNDAMKALKERINDIKSPSGSNTTQWPENVKNFVNEEGMLQQARQKLRVLLDLIKTEPRIVKPYFEQIQDLGRDNIVFDCLWTIFRPGDVVVSDTYFKEKQAFIVNFVSHDDITEDTPQKEKIDWSLICWAYDYQGSTFQRISVKLRIPFFRMPSPITALPVFPIRYLPQPRREELERALKAGGERFQKLCLERDKKMFEFKIDKQESESGSAEDHSDKSKETSNSQFAAPCSIWPIDHGSALMVQCPPL